MARTIAIGAYTIRLKTRREGVPTEFSLGGEFDGFSLLKDYFTARHRQLIRVGTPDPETDEYTDPRGMKLRVLQVDEASRRIDGIFDYGEAGAVRDIADFQTDKIVGQLTKTQAAFDPFYFSVWAEDRSRSALLLLQRLGVSGIKGMLEYDLKQYFRTETDGWVVALNALADLTALKEFIKSGVLRDIVLINRGATRESRRTLRRFQIKGTSLDQSEGAGQVTLRIEHDLTANLKNIASTVVGVARKTKPLSSLVRAPGFDEYDEMKVQVERNGRTQTFSLTNPSESIFKFDLTNKVRREASGHPSLTSMRENARVIYDDVRTLIE